MYVVRFFFAGSPGSIASEADAQLIHDALWVHTGPDDQIAHITVTALPYGIDVTLFLNSGINHPEQHATSVLGSIPRESPILRRWLGEPRKENNIVLEQAAPLNGKGLTPSPGLWSASQESCTGEAATLAVIVTERVSDIRQINELLANGVFVLLTPKVGAVPPRPRTEVTHRPPEQKVVHVSHLEIDAGEHIVRWHSRRLDLSEHEIGILASLADHAGHANSFVDLFRDVWGSSYHVDTTVVHSAIQRLRRKFAAANVTVTIDSVRAFGFRLNSPATPEPASLPPSTPQSASDRQNVQRFMTEGRVIKRWNSAR